MAASAPAPAKGGGAAEKSGGGAEKPVVGAGAREKAKLEMAQKAGVPMTFQWPSKKQEIGFESTGSKELDQDDALEGRAAPAGIAHCTGVPRL